MRTLRNGATGFLADLRNAARGLRRSPAFLATAAGTLGAALGVNIAMFALINAAVFRGPPYRAPEHLHRVIVGEDPVGGPFESPTLGRVRAALGDAAPVAGYTEHLFVIGSGDDAAAVSVQGSAADNALVDLIGMATSFGRAFTSDDVRPGALPVVILYESIAADQFGDARSAMGRTLRVDGVEHEVIGVVASNAVFPDLARVWVPLEDPNGRSTGAVRVIGRFAGVSPEVGASMIETALAGSGVQARARVVSIEPAGGVLFALVLGGIALVLLIACVNVANLMLVRGTGRRHELGVRAALGASRWRLVRYLSAEGIVLAAVNASLLFERDTSPFIVTGVVGDRRAAATGGLGVVDLSHAYVPLARGDLQFLSFIVRGTGNDAAALAPIVTAAIRASADDLVVLAPRLRSSVEGQGTGESQFFTALFAGFGAFAFAIALLGVHAVVAYTVGRRTREIGLRIALGATPLAVFRLVVSGVAGAVGSVPAWTA